MFTVGLFVVPNAQNDGPLGLEVRLDQRLDGRDRRDKPEFAVNGATAPNGLILDINVAREGWVNPLIQRLVRHRHNVLVRHENNRLERWVGAWPSV